MEFYIEIKKGEKDESIIHRASCLVASVRRYPLGELITYNSALLRAKQLGYTNLNGCYWCCFWNHISSSCQEEDIIE